MFLANKLGTALNEIEQNKRDFMAGWALNENTRREQTEVRVICNCLSIHFIGAVRNLDLSVIWSYIT